MKGSSWIWVGLLAPALALAAPQNGGGAGSAGAGSTSGTGGAGMAGQQPAENGNANGGAVTANGGNGAASGTGAVGGATAGQSLRNATHVAERGILQGTVTGVDYGKGRLQLAVGSRRVTIRGTPGQLQLFREGEFATLPYIQLAGNRWIATSSGQLAPQYFAAASTVIGTVHKTNKASGVVSLMHDGEKRTYFGSPQLVQGLLPGQFVSLTYEVIGNHRWIQQVRPAQRSATNR